ncbi:MAG: SRPBCC domain-containing protein [Chloroflexi bacterium]|nr:SRPBCC domain-containing protein [Chloroflexota bacterium]OJW05323.1 MAG: hypothetical protein BGO39_33480 [Chloroflexi bacterium 54-19]
MADYKGKTRVTANPLTREIIAERTFAAPRELVWKAWTEPERLAQWWGPRNWKMTIKEFDLRPGGTLFYVIQGPEGMESWARSVYQEIIPPEKLVYQDSFADKDGNTLPGMPRMTITNEFIEKNGQTTLVSRTTFDTDKDFNTIIAMGVEAGLGETWDRLGEFVETAA